MNGNKARQYRRQWLVSVGILALLGMAIAYDLSLDRRKTESLEYDRLLVQARVIDENLSHQLIATRTTLQRILDDLPYWRADGSYKPVANLMLSTIEGAMPEIRTLAIIDAKGIVRASTRRELIGRDLSEREYVQTVRRHHDPATLYLSPPYTTVLNAFAMNLSRMIPGRMGEFNGILVATLDPDYFKTLLASVQYAPDMWVAVAHGDGIQFQMVPDRPGQSGKNLAQPGSFFTRHRESGRTESIMTGRVYATGEDRVMALRTILPSDAHLDKPLVVAVGRDIRAVFAQWRMNAVLYGVVYMALVVVTVLFLRLYQISVRRADEKTRESEQALQQSEARYRLLAENTTDVVWQFDLSTNRYTYMSPSIYQLRGYTPEEIMAQPLEEQFTPESLKQVQGWIRQAVQEFASGRTALKQELREVEQPRKDGTTVWTEVSTTYILNADNKPVGVVGISRDITERRRIEKALINSEKKYRLLIESLQEGIWLIDADGNTSFVNQSMAQMLGYSIEEMLGRHLFSFMDERGKTIAMQQLESRRRGVKEQHDFEFLNKDGSRIYATLATSPILNDAGNYAGALAGVMNITDRKQVEDERERLISELQKALAEIKTLHGILPICSSCKKIRDDKGAWHQMEIYIHDHTDVEFSHGLCMECAKKMYPKYYKKDESETG